MYLRFVYSMSHVADMPHPDSHWDRMFKNMCQLEGIWQEIDEFLKKDKAAEAAKANADAEAKAKADAEAKAKADAEAKAKAAEEAAARKSRLKLQIT